MTVHRYAVLLRKPAAEKLAGLSRYEKYHRLRQHSAQTIERLLEWLKERDLGSQVKSVGPETIFNTVFLDATEDVKEALSQNPDVEEITEAPELDVHLTALS